MAGGYIRFDIPYLKLLPIRLPSPEQEQKINSLVNQMLELQKELHEKNPVGNEREELENKIKNVDYEIDEEVYKLYEITNEEKRIIEESLE